MKKHFAALALVLLAAGVMMFAAPAQNEPQPASGPVAPVPDRIAVVWTSGDPEVAHNVCLMYTHGTRKANWFKETLLVVWGPSARLLAADKDLQAKVTAMMEDGIAVKACVVCADSYGVSEQLQALGVEVLPMGAPLTRILKSSEWKVLTF